MNEIKVGQWAKVTYNKKTIIAKITDITNYHNSVQIWFNFGVSFHKDEIKIAYNLEDLLEVGDIVHLESYKYTVVTIIENETYIEDVKSDLKRGYKITAIELKENRVIQEVRE